MNPYQKGAKLLLQVMALGLIIVGGLFGAIELLGQRANSRALQLVPVIMGSAGFLAGVVLFLASAKIAARWTQDFDE